MCSSQLHLTSVFKCIVSKNVCTEVKVCMEKQFLLASIQRSAKYLYRKKFALEVRPLKELASWRNPYIRSWQIL